MHDAHESVLTLTTLSSPHHGASVCRVFKRQYAPKQGEMHSVETSPSMIEQAIDAVGLSMMNIKEFNAENMRAFNEVAEDHGGVEYYSMGSRRARTLCAEVL